MARTETILSDSEIALVAALDALATSGASQAIRKSGTATFANVNISSTNFTDNEVVAGSGTTFTLAATPVVGSVKVYAIGQKLTPTTDYTISGAIITTVNSWSAGDILADYRT